MIGDSQMSSLIFDLKNKLIDKNYQFITHTLDGCLYFPEFNLFNKKTKKINDLCNDNYFKSLSDTLSKEKNSIIIFGGREYFLRNFINKNNDNFLGDLFVSSGKYENIEQSFSNEILKLSKNNHIILIYPIPNVKVDVRKKLYLKFIKQPNLFESLPYDIITLSYDDYKKENKKTFEIFNSFNNFNVFIVYPHKLFCNTLLKNECIINDDKYLFYFDNNHPSLKGAEMINDLIMKEIEKIELKSN